MPSSANAQSPPRNPGKEEKEERQWSDRSLLSAKIGETDVTSGQNARAWMAVDEPQQLEPQCQCREVPEEINFDRRYPLIRCNFVKLRLATLLWARERRRRRHVGGCRSEDRLLPNPDSDAPHKGELGQSPAIGKPLVFLVMRWG